MAIFWLTPRFKGRIFDGSGFSADGIFIPNSAVLQYGRLIETVSIPYRYDRYFKYQTCHKHGEKYFF